LFVLFAELFPSGWSCSSFFFRYSLTPLLFLALLAGGGDKRLEIIFVSSDRTAQEMAAYMTEAHGDWLALDYAARDVKDSLSQASGVRGIPMLVVLGPDGQTVTTDGRQDVMSYGSAAFERWS
jgi:hypothetical protein